MTVRIVLGTANFGTNYGLRGAGHDSPKVDFKVASGIIDAATEIGITEVDTALTYGPSQKWLAELASEKNFLVNSKIIWEGANNFGDYTSSLKRIVDELKPCNLHLLQWHNWEKGTSTKDDYLRLHSLLGNERGHGYGVTTYGPVNVEEALSVDSFSSIQVEYNVLNQSALNAFLNFEGKSDMSLYIRSILLQGLLTDTLSFGNLKSQKLQQKVQKIQELAHEWSLSTQELALRSVMNKVGNCAIVIGVESGQQLYEIKGFIEKGPLPIELAEIISLLDSSLDSEVDPRNWVL